MAIRRTRAGIGRQAAKKKRKILKKLRSESPAGKARLKAGLSPLGKSTPGVKQGGSVPKQVVRPSRRRRRI